MNIMFELRQKCRKNYIDNYVKSVQALPLYPKLLILILRVSMAAELGGVAPVSLVQASETLRVSTIVTQQL